MKYVFIVNKIAGRGDYKKIIPNIENACIRRNIEYDIRYISKEKTGYDIAMEYHNSECIIYIVGGDGTLTITFPALIGTKNKLAIIPIGSGNDTFKAIKKLGEGENKIDIAKINNRYFINTASIGIDAAMGNNMDKFRNTIIPTSQRYNASIIYTFLGYKLKRIKFKTNLKNVNNRYTILSICNGMYYGGGYKIAPKSRLQDGLLDIYYVEGMNKLKIIPLIFKMKKGLHEGKRRIHKYRTNHIEIELEEIDTFNVDGEKMDGKKFIIDVIPKMLNVYYDNDFVNEVMGKVKE